MNNVEDTEPRVTQPTAPPKEKAKRKAKRKAKAKTTKVRTVDPTIAAIHAEASAKVKEYRKTQGSAGILTTILTKRLAQLTKRDREQLFNQLSGEFTPPLPMKEGA